MHITSIKCYYVLKVLSIIEIEESSVIKKQAVIFLLGSHLRRCPFPHQTNFLFFLWFADHTTGNPVFVPYRVRVRVKTDMFEKLSILSV